MRQTLKGDLLLFMTAVVWGLSIVAQKSSTQLMAPFAFNMLKTLMAALSLIPVIAVRKTGTVSDRRTLVTGGILCGAALFTAGGIQQMAFAYTTAGKVGFITALYVVFVPLISIFAGKRINMITIVGVAGAIFGLYLLCTPVDGNLLSEVNRGDVLTLVCAMFFAVHILVVGYYSAKTDGVKLSCLQFFTASILSIIPMLVVDPVISDKVFSFHAMLHNWIPILYSGIIGCGIGYTLQIVGQKYTSSTAASLIMSLESVMGVLFAALILNETLSFREGVGCAIMFASIIAVRIFGDRSHSETSTKIEKH